MPKTVFIVYSYDSPEHETWVLKLAEDLVKNGIDVKLDKWDLRPGADAHRYMEQSITNADRVLVVCTEKYTERANSREGAAGYEFQIIAAAIRRDHSTTKFVPIVRQKNTPFVLPTILDGRLHIDFSDDAELDAQIESLVQDIYDRPRFARPPLGPSRFDITPGPEAENETEPD